MRLLWRRAMTTDLVSRGGLPLFAAFLVWGRGKRRADDRPAADGLRVQRVGLPRHPTHRVALPLPDRRRADDRLPRRSPRTQAAGRDRLPDTGRRLGGRRVRAELHPVLRARIRRRYRPHDVQHHVHGHGRRLERAGVPWPGGRSPHHGAQNRTGDRAPAVRGHRVRVRPALRLPHQCGGEAHRGGHHHQDDGRDAAGARAAGTRGGAANRAHRERPDGSSRYSRPQVSRCSRSRRSAYI